MRERIGEGADSSFARGVGGEACKGVEGDEGAREDEVAGWLVSDFCRDVTGGFGIGVKPGVEGCVGHVYAGEVVAVHHGLELVNWGIGE